MKQKPSMLYMITNFINSLSFFPSPPQQFRRFQTVLNPSVLPVLYKKGHANN